MDRQNRELFKTLDKKFVMYLLRTTLAVRIDDYYVILVSEKKRFIVVYKDKELFHISYKMMSDRFSFLSAFVSAVTRLYLLAFTEYKNVVFYYMNDIKPIIIKTCRSKLCKWKCNGPYHFGEFTEIDSFVRFNNMFSLFGEYLNFKSITKAQSKELTK